MKCLCIVAVLAIFGCVSAQLQLLTPGALATMGLLPPLISYLNNPMRIPPPMPSPMVGPIGPPIVPPAPATRFFPGFPAYNLPITIQRNIYSTPMFGSY